MECTDKLSLPGVNQPAFADWLVSRTPLCGASGRIIIDEQVHFKHSAASRPLFKVMLRFGTRRPSAVRLWQEWRSQIM